ncbi:MAG TPA: hypothetical protein PLJ97_03670, partial [Candidatus Saccharibacteria bacterium]|nr:hypothetical protein [Candidatus Saccharibacteria bacterium]
MDPKKNTGKKYFDVAPPSAKPITAPLINTQKRRILSRSNLIKDENEKVDINTLTGSAGGDPKGKVEVDGSLGTEELAGDTIKVKVEPTEKEELPPPDEQVSEEPTTEDTGGPNKEEAPLTDLLSDSREEDRREEVVNLDTSRSTEPEEAEAVQKDTGGEPEEQSATLSVDESKNDDDNESNDDNDNDKEESPRELTDDEIQANTEEEDQKANETPQEQNAESETESERAESAEEEQEALENLTPVASRHSGDTSTALASGKNPELASDNQAPKIYDTKEYHVPI